MATKNIWQSLAQDCGLFKRHMKKTFILLLTLAFLLSAVAYVFETTTFSQTWLNKVMNRTHYKVIKSTSADRNQKDLLAPLPNQYIQPRGTTIYHHVAHPSNYHFILDEPDKCKQDPFLVLMVPVAPHQLEARNSIRSTWGNESSVQGKAVLTLFLVGLTGGAVAQHQLEEESRQHRDLLQSNFVDSYFNLTIKTMVIMDWLATHCPQAAYAMKVDSDMYINLENLMSLLLSPNTPRQNYITGHLMRNEVVVRNKNSKWYVAVELYPEPTYPTYLLGMGYVFSNDLPKKLVQASKKVKPFNIEDAYVGACLKQLGVAPSSPPNPSQFKLFLGQDNQEDFLRVITTILSSPQELIKIWKDLKGLT
ncbi:beta-1,3-galactosyltransferase 2 isoform X1 [Carassius gibelio]|uniref:beta-1,3-galactosyltransferase 2 isoform X1 n=1 Tax=Carassius gibelio TaxID=101364 RepID=UPI002278EEB1|nr:beta-1,3-galactosyltransferase 2 isoform X1 [Carassius gibelio]XP_052445850.1 beta-1,3-galactosyltransferase 2 isoform X1 [Carassius gibelio]XP_052445851.1 beta-1,3-galactosyltransferase 2 isoform X1 [Carassius gibelio]XP_052445853.1 beta-1,3-galactosyltransferase 2 isoform X1 [Carassius gibelio]XP_052445854.1 beta-1,3-galactosyltransferase 2 isoform X1 [Carassius gibelio]XP_052445855.1 beta-1,3-galactosyltransferase 2 isoform X1 [Carassius gibelio]XP_052445856.1 beta-1,3-galactosyltransfe